MVSLSRALVVLVVLTSASLLGPAPIQAQRFAVAGQVGTTGLGGGVVIGLVPRINLRSMFGVIPIDRTVNIEDIDFVPDFPSFLLTTLDLYAVGSLHLSGGMLLITDNGMMGVEGSFEGQSVDFGGMTYTGSADDRLNGTIALKEWQPYLGLGIGNALGQRISFNFDVGVGFGSEPVVALTATGPLAEDPVTGPEYLMGVEDKERDIEDALPTLLRYYPVFAISFSFRF